MKMLDLAGSKALLAYLDPGSGSYLLQLLIGGILGALFLLRAYWGRIKSFVGRILLRPKSEGDGNPE